MIIRSAASDRLDNTFTIPGKGFLYGGDYNPEQWSPDVWLEDAELMQQAGVNVVSLGVFAWGKIEVADNVFEFGWMDRVFDILHERGIAITLATPTAAPPMWLIQTHPEIMTTDACGLQTGQGGRLGWSPNSATFRRYALRMVENLATHYGTHPALALWHVSNEIGNENGYDFGEETADAFRKWVQARYTTLEALNQAWGANFWGHTFSSFSQVTPPRFSRTSHNPALLLDFDRFTSNALLQHYIAERDVLRRITPQIPITTNFMVMRSGGVQDYAAWASETDVVSNDHYTIGSNPPMHEELSFSADRTRGIAHGAPWILMEHSASSVNWQGRNASKEPGELTRNSLAHVARGADAVCFFQWRQSASGAEQFHSGMVPHAGADSKVFREVTALGVTLDRIAEVAGTVLPPADAALLWDQQSVWAFNSTRKAADDIAFHAMPLAIHAALNHHHVATDVIVPTQDFGGYRLVVVPNLFLADDELTRKLTAYANSGGHVLVTYLSGIVDPTCAVILGGYPGAFRKLLGLRVDEFYPLFNQESRPIVTSAGVHWAASDWTESIELAGATSYATYTSGTLCGSAAITQNVVGAGTASYLSTRLEVGALDDFIEHLIEVSGITPLASAPREVEITKRSNSEHDFIFAINHLAVDAKVDLGVLSYDLVTGSPFDGCLAAGGVAVLKVDRQ
jgi:beta-galactosidase